MKTIEERAKEYCHREKVENVDCLHAYIIGAAEQKATDDDHFREVKKMVIDKAWKFIESIVEYTGLDSSGLEEEYKKTMEE